MLVSVSSRRGSFSRPILVSLQTLWNQKFESLKNTWNRTNYFQVTQCSAKTGVDECEHFLHKVVVSQWPQISWSTVGLIGPPWCSLYWLAFRLLLASDWPFRLFTMPSCGHVSYKLVAMLTWVSFVLCLTCYNSALHMCLRCDFFESLIFFENVCSEKVTFSSKNKFFGWDWIFYWYCILEDNRKGNAMKVEGRVRLSDDLVRGLVTGQSVPGICFR